MRNKRIIPFTFLLGLLWLLIAACANQSAPPAAVEEQDAAKGGYTLVSIGPGDADLITVRALEAIRRADVVFCDQKTRERLASLIDFRDKEVHDGFSVLFRFYGRDCARLPEAERTWRGRSCEDNHRKQEELITTVRAAVQAGKQVVMLSSGDPTIYGPDLWTVKALADLKPTVVPGISALNAANAALKASLGEVIITAPFQKAGSPR